MHRDFGVEEDHTYFDLVLPDGNYSVYEILDKFTELHANDFTYEYDEVRNKVTISSLFRTIRYDTSRICPRFSRVAAINSR